MAFKKLDSFLAGPLAVFLFLFECKKFIDDFKEPLVFSIDTLYSDIELFLPNELGFHVNVLLCYKITFIS